MNHSAVPTATTRRALTRIGGGVTRSGTMRIVVRCELRGAVRRSRPGAVRRRTSAPGRRTVAVRGTLAAGAGRRAGRAAGRVARRAGDARCAGNGVAGWRVTRGADGRAPVRGGARGRTDPGG